MEKLRQQVVTDIRLNQQLEADLNQMDIKIGLLVKNRITLQVQHFLSHLLCQFIVHLLLPCLHRMLDLLVYSLLSLGLLVFRSCWIVVIHVA